QVVVLAPVGRDVLVDDARRLVPDRLRVAVAAHGREDGLPDVPLVGGAAARAEDGFEAYGLLDGCRDVAVGIALGRPRRAGERAGLPVGVLVVVDVDGLVGAEVQGMGAEAEGAPEVVGIEALRRQRLPAAGRAAIHDARPRLADAAETPLDLGD